MRRVLLLLFLLASSWAHSLGLADEALEGPDTVYTGWLADVLMRWPASRPDADGSASLQLTCISTVSDDRYVGMLQQMTVAAPLSAIEKVLDDVPHYKLVSLTCTCCRDRETGTGISPFGSSAFRCSFCRT
jgi:hypothetical protein